MENLSDIELIRLFFKGNDKALEFLFSKNIDAVYFLVSRYIKDENASDITQEAFIKAWRNLKKFKKDGNFKSWVLTIARNCAIDYLRRRKELPFSEIEKNSSEEDFKIDVADTKPLILELLEKQSDEEKLNQAIFQLSESNRLVLNLRHKEDLKFEEMAEVLGEPLNTVKSRYLRALKKLKSLLLS
jgi:RNA polymerase sigma-70 factor (ECF subfamily)